MNTGISIYSMDKKEIEKFLSSYYNKNIELNKAEWEKQYANPIEMADIIGVFIDNNDIFKINMWVNIDKGFWVNITNNNANQIIKYLYERFPY